MAVCLLITAMNMAGKVYFDAVSKIGENAAVSPVSRELGKCLPACPWQALKPVPSPAIPPTPGRMSHDGVHGQESTEPISPSPSGPRREGEKK